VERSVSAPGKLFVSGEYAVLWGGTARIAAAGPRGSALVRRREDREVHLAIDAGRLRGFATPLGVNWNRSPPKEFSFAARTLSLALRLHGKEALGFELALSPSLLEPTDGKPGLGGSARATLLAAEAARYILEERFDALKLALVAHWEIQGGKGSGGDIAAIFAGGMIRYRRYPLERLHGARKSGDLIAALASAPPVDIWRLPVAQLSLSYAFSGGSASTPNLIAEVEGRMPPPRREKFVDRSEALGDSLESAIAKGNFEAIREAVEGLHALLKELGPLETESMRRILAIARTYGGCGKISGAGGGDGCILFSPDAQSQAAMLEGLKARGIWALSMPLEPGLRGELQPDETLQSWLKR